MTDVDNRAKDYSEVDWQNADVQFADFNETQFPKWENLMTPSEKDKVNAMIGKYQALQVKRGIKGLKNQVNNVIDQTKTMFKELTTDSSLTK